MHLIDKTAYTGTTPWHGLGTRLDQNATLEVWREQAGLAWQAMAAPVTFITAADGQVHTVASKKVLYRSDNGYPLSVVGAAYNIVQPGDILDLYAKIAAAGGAVLETAGSLDKGRRIWALARINDSAFIANGDKVRPYVLLATSFDGTLATTVKPTTVRVVCNNTLHIATRQPGGARVFHSTRWNESIANRVLSEIGFARTAFERFVFAARKAAHDELSQAQAESIIARVFAQANGVEEDKARAGTGYKRVMQLFKGAAIGSEIAGQTRWGLLNAVTQYIDHERGWTQDSRLNSSWFGNGALFKESAKQAILMEAV